MDNEEELINKYRNVGRMKGNELLLKPHDALHFIEDCRSLHITILGMNFFREEGGYLIETLGPADYSSLKGMPDAAAQSAEEARSLIYDGLPDGAAWVSFVLDA